ncbi:DUF3558 family protein [Actinokineospora xionganensis]|uniref:DUF3558 domain-containing protein n=1 Tax=Actinokineospora xionganensis TaxID=2684470 RepID=A0ABR7LEP8_9PSEU|nr:DUF3558 family protein [Actinokineospora xionganensis]MBC6450861.1 DUF3558 domain-containing protein [Actinokineospora xionganensis]
MVSGSAVPNEAAGALSVRLGGADGGLGDLTTVDFCSLLDGKAIKDLVRHQNVEFGSLDYCVLFAEADGEDIQVSVELVNPPPNVHNLDLERRAWLPDPLRVGPHDDVEGGCETGIFFKDGKAVLSFAARTQPDDKGEPAIDQDDLCEIADALRQAAATVIVEGRVKHTEYAANSLGRVDPCTLLTVQQIDKAVPTSFGQGAGSPARHRCTWGTDEELELAAEISDWPLDEEFYTPETIAGRPSFVYTSKDDRFAYCEVLTANIEDAPNTRETMSVYFSDEIGQPDPCVAARTLAALVWPQLPATS